MVNNCKLFILYESKQLKVFNLFLKRFKEFLKIIILAQTLTTSNDTDFFSIFCIDFKRDFCSK